MIRQLFLAVILATGVSEVAMSAPVMARADQAVLAAEVAVVEGYVLQFQSDPVGLQAAVEAYVERASDPALAASAVIAVYGSSANPRVVQILLDSAELKAALGKGLGAAIALIGVTDPDLATRVAALVAAAGDAALAASVDDGNGSKTASILERHHSQRSGFMGDATPEQTGSEG